MLTSYVHAYGRPYIKGLYVSYNDIMNRSAYMMIIVVKLCTPHSSQEMWKNVHFQIIIKIIFRIINFVDPDQTTPTVFTVYAF